jgi:phosphonate transport system permease protein
MTAVLPPKPRNFKWLWLLFAALLIALIIVDLDINPTTVIWAYEDIREYFSRYSHPDFSGWQHYAALMFQTVVIAYWGTALAFGIGFVLAPFASRALTPGPLAYNAARETLNLLRAIPDLMLALIFVSSLGLGPLPGILALGLHTGGFLGKFFSESMDRVAPGRYDAIAAVGAGFAQRVMFVGWPSIRRETAGYTLYIFDRNVRMSAVLGLVGAGGIGMELQTALRLFNYDQAAVLILLLMVTIFSIDTLSGFLREKLR